MVCQRCKGYIWTEQERGGTESYKERAKKYGIDVVCIGGHRITLTSEDYKEYVKEKDKGVKNDTRKLVHN